MDVKKFKFLLFFLMFFQNCCLLAEPETVKTSISQVSQPIIFLAKSLVEKRKRGEFLEMPFISITGCCAVGKTEFAKSLKAELEKENIRVEILKQDDFIRPYKMSVGRFKHPWLNHSEMHRVINEIKNGKLHVDRPRFDWRSLLVTYETLDLTNIDVVVFEGLYVLNSDAPYDFNRYANIHIFIDASEEDIIRWSWLRERDFKDNFCIPMTNGTFDKKIARIMRDYRKYILPKKKKADFVIEKDKNHNYFLVIDKIINW